MNNKLLELLCNSLDGSLYDIAVIVHYLYHETYVVGKLRSKVWFKFENHKWKQTELGPYYELSTNVLQIYNDFYKSILNDTISCYTLLELDISTNESLNINNIKDFALLKCDVINKKLKNVNFKEQICKECLYLFYNENFIFKLDKNHNLICFLNGVLDNNTKEFRDGVPSDYTLMHIDKDYVEPFNDVECIDFPKLINKFNLFRNEILKKRTSKNIYKVE